MKQTELTQRKETRIQEAENAGDRVSECSQRHQKAHNTYIKHIMKREEHRNSNLTFEVNNSTEGQIEE